MARPKKNRKVVTKANSGKQDRTSSNSGRESKFISVESDMHNEPGTGSQAIFYPSRGY